MGSQTIQLLNYKCAECGAQGYAYQSRVRVEHLPRCELVARMEREFPGLVKMIRWERTERLMKKRTNRRNYKERQKV